MVLIASLTLVFFSDENDTAPLVVISSHKSSDSVIDTDNTEKTIATAWQWEESSNATTDTDTNEEQSSAVFSEESVYNALQRVRLDNQGNIIIDNETLIALDETLDGSHLQLDGQALSDLQMIIKQGLPGKAGDDVAKIVGDYYQLLGATKEFNAVYETDPSTEQVVENTIEQHQENYRELIALRELYMGTDLASQLFSTSNANANYMFDMHKIEQDTELSDDEKQKLRAEITDRHTEQTINVSNWNARHNAFLVAKQNILMALISDEEKQGQLTELMHQHFNSKELAHVRHLHLDKP
jgi:hypothetical protein